MGKTANLFSDGSERVPYENPDFPVYAGRSWLSALENMRFAHHWHDDLEFSFMLSGHMIYFVDGAAIELKAGEGIFVNARRVHGNYSADKTDAEYICALVHPSLLCLNAYLDRECVAPLTANNAMPYLILRPEVAWQGELLGCVRGVWEALSGGDAGGFLAAQGLFFRMAALLFAHMPAQRLGLTRGDRRLAALREMIGHIQKNYAEKMTLADIARAGHMGESACCALFRGQFRQTPVEYLIRYRLEKSLALLANPGLSVTEIALGVGFSGPSYFAECFRARLGMTPSAYRKAKGNAGSSAPGTPSSGRIEL
jgi:AraC-like DNA-binding protein